MTRAVISVELFLSCLHSPLVILADFCDVDSLLRIIYCCIITKRCLLDRGVSCPTANDKHRSNYSSTSSANEVRKRLQHGLRYPPSCLPHGVTTAIIRLDLRLLLQASHAYSTRALQSTCNPPHRVTKLPNHIHHHHQQPLYTLAGLRPARQPTSHV